MANNELYQFGAMNELNVGGYMMIKNYPCKITEKSVSKTGKHGSSKAHVVGKDIFTDKKYEEIFGSSEKVQVPVINRVTYIVQFVEENQENTGLLNVYVMEEEQARLLPIQVNKNNEADMETITKINELLENESDGDCVISVIQAMNKERITQCTKSKK
jgi:translation initiation factor 5A